VERGAAQNTLLAYRRDLAGFERFLTRERRGLEARSGGIAVIVQQMVDAEKSGVTFSRAPTGNSALVYTEASWGLGEGVVSGTVEVDGYWADRFHSPVRRSIARKERMASFDPSTGTLGLLAVPAERIEQPTLSETELADLGRAALRVELELGKPCDLEWCFAGGRLFLLQARPITQPMPALRCYTDTNLVESYPGRTSPLTASFVKRVYARVFRQSARLLTMSRTIPPQLDPCYDRLIACFGGHLYYDLESYYAALLALPGGRKNVDAWHRMIGGQPDPSIDLDRFWQPSPWVTAKAAFSLLRLVLRHRALFERFYEEADRTSAGLDERLARAGRSQDLARLMIESFESTRGFELTILNDVLLMGSLRALLRQLKKNGLDEREAPALVRTRQVVESLKPLEEIRALAEALAAAPSAMRRLCESIEGWDGGDPARLYSDIAAGIAADGRSDLAERLTGYLARFGDRSFEELKLESMTFSQSPQLFLRFLKWQISQPRAVAAVEARKDEAESKLATLPLPRRIALRRLLRTTHRYIETRERSRLVRGRFYGWFRKAFLRVSQQLRAEQPELFGGLRPLDFFALTLEDLERYSSGALESRQLAERIRADAARPSAARSVWPELFCHPEDPAGAVVPYFAEAEEPTAALTVAAELIGTGAAGGSVRGTALVLASPQEALSTSDLAERILVTANTDPAWVFLMSRCKGLVSEKGSLLSHTAIIGRELGIPTVVGVRNATHSITTGAPLEIDGTTGRIRLG
jgi:pyruvate,water dikinase